jgi:hypothetical protein
MVSRESGVVQAAMGVSFCISTCPLATGSILPVGGNPAPDAEEDIFSFFEPLGAFEPPYLAVNAAGEPQELMADTAVRGMEPHI